MWEYSGRWKKGKKKGTWVWGWMLVNPCAHLGPTWCGWTHHNTVWRNVYSRTGCNVMSGSKSSFTGRFYSLHLLFLSCITWNTAGIASGYDLIGLSWTLVKLVLSSAPTIRPMNSLWTFDRQQTLDLQNYLLPTFCCLWRNKNTWMQVHCVYFSVWQSKGSFCVWLYAFNLIILMDQAIASNLLQVF